MIAWRNPAALAGLLALVLPILIHLLRRQRARRVAFPSIRFVRRASAAAVRLRAPSDPWLLALRLAILGLAAAAVAEPIVLTDGRLASWNSRVVRALVIDASESTRPFARAIRERADAEMRDASDVLRIESGDLRTALRRAAAWLEAAAPARREIVVVSDFQAGAIDRTQAGDIPAGVGVRFVPVRTPVGERRLAGVELLSGHRLETVLSGPSTRVTVFPGRSRESALRLLVADRDARAAARLMEVLENAGTPAPAEPVTFVFPDAAAPAGENAVIVRHPPSSLEAARAVRDALLERAGPLARPEAEVLTIPDADLTAWTRPAPPIGADIARQADVSDARWVWLAVLALFGIEAYARRNRREGNGEREEQAHAA